MAEQRKAPTAPILHDLNMSSMLRLIQAVAKFVIFGCFLAALASFSAVATVRYIFATSRVEIPNLVGKELDYASSIATERHLRLKTVDTQTASDIAEQHIIAQEPAPGKKIQKGQAIRIVVSKGTESLSLPDVVGKPWQDAKRILRNASFRLGNVAYAHSEAIPVDAVVAQNPRPYTEVNTGVRVDLLVSRGPYRKVMVMPDLVEEQLSYALEMIETLGLILSKVEHEDYPGMPPNTVLSHVPTPGTLVEEQNMVTLVVSGQRGRHDFFTPRQPAVHYQSLEYVVPPGRYEREVSVVVRNRDGASEIFRQFVPPGEKIMVRIPVAGQTNVEISLDGRLDTTQRMSNEQ